MEPVRVETVMLLPLIVEYIAIGAVICVVIITVLPVSVDNARWAAFMLATFDDRMVK